MPMSVEYLDLELDIVEKYGAGRLPQEMAKSDSKGGQNPHQHGMHPHLIKHKMAKTKKYVGVNITQVTNL